MTGFVYAIEGAENRIKIGWSADPMRRLSKLRSDCSAEVVLLGLVEATREQEGELHRLLEPWRLHGEWFAHEGAVCQFIELLPTPAIRAVNQQMIQWPVAAIAGGDGRNLLRKYIEETTTQAEFAGAIGVSEPHMSDLLRGRRAFTLALAKRISERTGIPVEYFPHRGMAA